MKMKTKVIPMVVIALIGICILASIVSAETAEEWTEKGLSFTPYEMVKAIECFNKAVEECDKAIELDPSDADAYNSRGLAYFCLSSDKRAMDDFNRAIELDPNLADAYINRGIRYCYFSQDEKAIEEFNNAIRVDPNNADAYYYRGLMYYDSSQDGRAIDDFNKTIELDPNYAIAYINRGKIAYRLKQYEIAIEDFNRAIELEPNNDYAYIQRGNAYAGLKQYKRAIEDFNRAIQLDPNDLHDAHHYRDLAYRAGKSKKQKSTPGQKLTLEQTLTPGFETISAITGFLAVTYLLRVRKLNGGSKGGLR